MPGGFVEYRFRVHDGAPATLAAFRAATGGAAITVTSVRGDTSPYLVSAPHGDGASVDVFTGKVKAATYTGQIADAVTATVPNVLRIFSAQIEDAGGLQQLGNRYAAFDFRLNGGAWQVLTLGLLTRFTLSSNITWDVTIDDPTTGENGHMAFAPQQDPATGQIETIAQYLARWPNRGCIFGGPITGGFLNQPDRGGWEMTVNGRFGPAGVDNDVVQETFLDFHYGYAAPLFKRSTDAQACMAAAKNKTDSLFRRNPIAGSDGLLPAGFITTLADSQGGQWADVVVEIIGVGYCTPRSGLFYRDHSGKDTLANGDDVHLLHDIRFRGVYVHTLPLGTGGMPADGSAVRVRAYTAQVSDISPIYWAGHPVDLLTKLWDEAGLGWDATAVANTRAAIGAHRYIALRITAPAEMGGFLENTVYGPFGIGVAVNGQGELAPFATRRFTNAVASATITNATVVRGSTKPFDLDLSTAIRKVTFEHDRLVLPRNSGDDSSVDGFLVQHERYEYINNDAGALGTQEVNYSIPGMVGFVNPDNSLADDVQGYSTAIAIDVFSRAGRGMRVGATTVIRGADAALDALNLGDEVLVALKELPNHNRRLGDDNTVAARAMQIVQRTVTASGYAIELADSGPNAQPYATLPTVSLAASSDRSSTVALLTITNAATLNAASVGARVQMAVTTGAAPAAGDYTDVAYYVPGAIPTTAMRLPAVTAGATVWVQARSETPAFRPSNYSTPIHLALTALAAPSALTAAPLAGDGSQCQLTWTPGTTDGAYDTDVYLRASGAPSSAAVRVISLASASVAYMLEGLTPGASYTAGVQHRERATGTVSATTEVTFAANATTATLDPPSDPNGFSGSQDPRYGFPQQDGVYGLAVAATEFPGLTEFQEAVETAPYSGVYGTPTTVAKIANVQGDWTFFELVATNDGLTRQLTARHVRDGATASAYTDPVIVAPWTAKRLGVFATVVQAEELSAFTFTESSDNTQRTYGWVRGALVESVHVYAQTMPVPIVSDPFNFGGALPVATLRAGADSYTVAKPLSGTQLFLQFEPRMADLTAGSVRRGVVDPASIITPTATMRAVKSADGSTEDLYITPKSPAQEQLAVLYRDGDTSAAPLYQLCIGASDARSRFVNSGVEIGPTDWFLPLAGGSLVQVLAAIVVRDLQVKRVTVGVQGKDTLAEAWIPWDMVMANVATGSIAISFDPVSGNTAAQAYYGFTADLPANAQSARWSVNVTVAASNTGVPNYPVDATVAAGGTLNTAGRTFSITARGPINLGDLVSITVIPFTGTSGGGTQLPSLHRYATFASFVTAKSVRMGPTEFAYSSGPAIQQQLGYLNPATTGLLVAYAQLKGIPTGVPITTFSARLFRETGVGTAELQVYKIDTSGVPSGPIGGVLLHTTTGWQTVSVSVTETTDGSVYYLYVALEQLTEPHNTSVRCAYAEAFYTSTDVSKPGAG